MNGVPSLTAGQVLTVDRPSTLTLNAKLTPIRFAITNEGYEVEIDNLTIVLEIDEHKNLWLSTSSGFIICENNYHAWKTDDFEVYSLDFKFTDGDAPVGDAISVPYIATGKGGNYRPVPQDPIRKPYNGPFEAIKSLELFSKNVLFYLDEG